jgi:hypothetical protein
MDINNWLEYHDKGAERHCAGTKGKERYHPLIPETILLHDEEKGMLQYYFDKEKEVLFVTGIVGDLLYWKSVALQLARDFGANKIVAYSPTKNPKALARLSGFTLSRTRYEFELEVTK